ncbi:MAG: hypothetical protein MZU84_02035 [Sphingobacterium sp.]|nr:hypothetical protein [Sphingobacterium sp.]
MDHPEETALFHSHLLQARPQGPAGALVADPGPLLGLARSTPLPAVCMDLRTWDSSA